MKRRNSQGSPAVCLSSPSFPPSFSFTFAPRLPSLFRFSTLRPPTSSNTPSLPPHLFFECAHRLFSSHSDFSSSLLFPAFISLLCFLLGFTLFSLSFLIFCLPSILPSLKTVHLQSFSSPSLASLVFLLHHQSVCPSSLFLPFLYLLLLPQSGLVSLIPPHPPLLRPILFYSLFLSHPSFSSLPPSIPPFWPLPLQGHFYYKG